MTRSSISALFILLLTASLAFAGRTACPQFYVDGVAPDFVNRKLTPKTRQLCNDGYGVEHSGLTRTPLWAAERLTRDGLQRAKGLPRVNSFRPDPRLPVSERAELRDFARSGYDRGHQASLADQHTEASRDQTFFLSNMIPQDSDNNRNLWEGIETAIRNETKRRGELYVLTGPLFQGNQIQSLKGRVMIPTGLFKAVYDPARREAGAYVVANAPGMQYQVVSIAQLEGITGIRLFPSLSAKIRNNAMRLPEPRTYQQRRGGNQ